MLRLFRVSSKLPQQLIHTAAPMSRFCTVSLDKIQRKTQGIMQGAYATFEDDREEIEFEEFCNKLNQFYKLERRRKSRFNKKDQEFKRIIMSSVTPIRDTLQLYPIYNRHGFDQDLLADCLSHIAAMIRIKGRVQDTHDDVAVPPLYPCNTNTITSMSSCLITGGSRIWSLI